MNCPCPLINKEKTLVRAQLVLDHLSDYIETPLFIVLEPDNMLDLDFAQIVIPNENFLQLYSKTEQIEMKEKQYFVLRVLRGMNHLKPNEKELAYWHYIKGISLSALKRGLNDYDICISRSYNINKSLINRISIMVQDFIVYKEEL